MASGIARTCGSSPGGHSSRCSKATDLPSSVWSAITGCSTTSPRSAGSAPSPRASCSVSSRHCSSATFSPTSTSRSRAAESAAADVQVLLVGPALAGGEGAYMDLLRAHPPQGVEYVSTGSFKTGAPGARCALAWEVALNQLLRPRAIPDIGFRAFRIDGEFDLVHVHAHPVRLAGLGDRPLVMSEGSSSAVYLGEYLGWSEERMSARFARARRLYRTLRVHDRLLNLDRVTRAYVFSEWARRLNIRWGADPAKLSVISPGFDTPPPPARGERDTFTFLFVGTDFERKGGFDLVEAFARIAGDLTHVRLVVAGSDPHTPNPDRF